MLHHNIIYDVVTNNTGSSNGVGIAISGAESGTNTIHDNQIQQVNTRGICIQNTSGFTNISFADNVYYSSLSQNNYCNRCGRGWSAYRLTAYDFFLSGNAKADFWRASLPRPPAPIPHHHQQPNLLCAGRKRENSNHRQAR